MNNISKFPESFFRLLVPATELTPLDVPYVELCGSRWVLTELMPISDAPPYTCISYSWGRGRTKNPLNYDQLISDRTIPAIEAAIKVSQSQKNWTNVQFSFSCDTQKEEAGQVAALKASQAFWIDALCVPPQESDKAACLRSLGVIYSSAWQVFVILSESCSSVVHQIRDTGHLDLAALFILDSDDWITRAWVYQEAVNSKSLYFIAQDDETILVSGLDFLNEVMTATSDYRNAHGIDPFTWGEQHPRLESLENLIADYRIAEYAARSALQVMSVIHQRVVKRDEDLFYAMVGAITNLSLESQGNQLIHPSEYFVRVCEAKGDYSFIYCVAPRSDVQGRHWRPIAGKIYPAISGLLISGDGQSGYLEATHLQLKNMYRMSHDGVNSDAIKDIGKFLQSDITKSSPSDIADSILERLRQKGFSGCGEYLELENGFFFPQSTFTHSDDIFVAISLDVRWTNGGPGLLLRTNGTEINQFCDVGVYIGRHPKVGESINVG